MRPLKIEEAPARGVEPPELRTEPEHVSAALPKDGNSPTFLKKTSQPDISTCLRQASLRGEADAKRVERAHDVQSFAFVVAST
jgi:hypothetical protein